MAKLNLLKSREDFSRFRNSRSYQTSALRIRIVSSVNQNIPRFGFIVPKKVLPKASERNIIKRRLKSILSKSQTKFRAVDLLFFPQKSLLKKKFIDLETETLNLIKRAGIWKS
ncbi:MAG TPA: ribonuclease P protein component [Methylomirabilota bacterium]|jgi:ribonuclease P protein component|nr:ribonuclease P protein component [Methylomirabilota bacterium]